MPGVVCQKVEMAFPTASGPLKVLNGVDFEARAGELTLLVGPSGCGKTTLISIIAGLLRGAGGRVEVFGHPVTTMSGSQLLSYRLAKIGFIFQQYNLLSGLTAAENAAVPLVAAGVPWPQALERSTSMLQKLGMGDQAHKHPRQMSVGQQQRVAIARALVHGPQLLLCDEPTASLDGKSGHAVMSLLRELAVHPDRAAIVVTHDPRVYGFADRIVSMEDGIIQGVETGDASRRAPAVPTP